MENVDVKEEARDDEDSAREIGMVSPYLCKLYSITSWVSILLFIPSFIYNSSLFQARVVFAYYLGMISTKTVLMRAIPMLIFLLLIAFLFKASFVFLAIKYIPSCRGIKKYHTSLVLAIPIVSFLIGSLCMSVLQIHFTKGNPSWTIFYMETYSSIIAYIVMCCWMLHLFLKHQFV